MTEIMMSPTRVSKLSAAAATRGASYHFPPRLMTDWLLSALAVSRTRRLVLSIHTAKNSCVSDVPTDYLIFEYRFETKRSVFNLKTKTKCGSLLSRSGIHNLTLELMSSVLQTGFITILSSYYCYYYYYY